MSSPHVHRRQLFHWIGKHIDGVSKLSAAERRQQYLDALAGSLAGGLWMNRLRENLGFRGAPSHVLERRAVCFTENRLSDCRFHASNYGHLGLGFPKRFVLDAGGKPVSYVAHKQGDLYTRSLLTALAAAPVGRAQDDLDFVAHFVKPLHRSPKPRPAGAAAATRAVPDPLTPPGSPALRRQFGRPMLYHAEAEWRVVQHDELLARAADRFERLDPDYERTLLRYRPGHDLMTVIFPDVRTQHEALLHPDIGPRLTDPNHPPVAMYTIQEIAEL